MKALKTEKDTGAEYRGKKAKGDIKQKGKHDPYAYVPLSRSALNKRYGFKIKFHYNRDLFLFEFRL